MVEADLNRIIAKNLDETAFGYKIPDPQKANAMTASKRPFDLFGETHDATVYAESKLMKGGFQAFSFSHIRPHQRENLLRINQATAHRVNRPLTLIILGVWESRKFFGLFFFDILFVDRLMNEPGRKSILKKELEAFYENVQYLTIKKEVFDVQSIQEKVIYDWPESGAIDGNRKAAS